MLTDDFIARHQITLRDVRGSTRWISKESNAWFGGVTTNDLMMAASSGVEVVVQFLRSNAEVRGNKPDSQLLERVALKTVISFLHAHHVNREPLVITDSDLRSSTIKGECADCCKRALGSSYAGIASALLGLTVEELVAWEEGQRIFVERCRS